MPFKRGILLLMGLCILIASAEPLLRNGGAANNGQIAFVSTRGGNSEIYVMDSDGKRQRRVTTHAAADSHPTWSPDGKKIAFVSNRNGGYIQIWAVDADGRNPIRLTDGVWDQNPDWSPDGKRIAYDVLLNPWDNGKWIRTIRVMDSDGRNSRQLIKEPAYDTHPSWSPDSQKIIFLSSREDETTEIFVVEADGRNLKRITFDFMEKSMLTWSPNGKRIAFVRDLHIYVMDSNGENQRRITEKGLNRYPTWSPDSHTVAFESWEKDGAEHGIYTVDVRSGALTQLSEVHKRGDYQPDWLNPVGLPVSPAGSRITIWGGLKKVASNLR